MLEAVAQAQYKGFWSENETVLARARSDPLGCTNSARRQRLVGDKSPGIRVSRPLQSQFPLKLPPLLSDTETGNLVSLVHAIYKHQNVTFARIFSSWPK
jgi:hypothetical protein